MIEETRQSYEELKRSRNYQRDRAVKAKASRKAMAEGLNAAVEAMRAKCEAIARDEYEKIRLPCRLVAERIADAIAVLK